MTRTPKQLEIKTPPPGRVPRGWWQRYAHRLDTGEVVETRPMTPEERQHSLFPAARSTRSRSSTGGAEDEADA